jgi:hypothetical protein
MGYNTFLSYSTTNIPCYLPKSEETRQKLLNIRSSIKDNMLYVFFSSYVLKNERKEFKTPNTFNLMLEAKVVNFNETLMSSSMKDSKEGFKCI